MTIKPISPNEVVEKKQEIFPGEVIGCLNHLIAKNWDGHKSVILQVEIVEQICEVMKIEKVKVYDNNYLEIEDIYRDQGWCVEYDKPGYNEVYYPPSFTFTKGGEKG